MNLDGNFYSPDILMYVMEKDYYSILGVNKDASQDEIKKAYRKIAIENHPDKKPGDPVAEERFKEAAEAYSVLSDPDKRRAYDSPGPQGIDFEDIFSVFFGQGSQTAVGRDIGINLRITLKEALTGMTKEIKYPRTVVCPECHGQGGEGREVCKDCKGRGNVYRGGNGFFQSTRCPSCSGRGYTLKNVCKKCQGSGVIKSTNTIEINLKPSEYYPGLTFLYPGLGDMVSAGVSGDLRIGISVIEDPRFEVRGRDILGTLELPLKTALLGGEIEIKTPKDEVIKETLNPKTQTDTILEYPGEGFQGGKLYIRLKVTLPDLSEEQKTMISKIL